MIFCDEGGLRIDSLNFPERYLPGLRSEEEESKLDFQIPDKFKSNKEKAIYKIGFLHGFLKRLYPDEPYPSIVQIMNDRYQIFIGQRQIERNVKEYLKNDIYR